MSVSRGVPSSLPLLLVWSALLLEGSSGCFSHSLRYFSTSVSEPGQQEPQFLLVGYVDDQQVVSYDSKAKMCVPTVPWIREGQGYSHSWRWNSYVVQNTEQVFREYLPGYYNQSRGAHTWQSMYSCELRRDGSKEGHIRFAYDGADYISLDKETLTWTATDVPVENNKKKREAEQVVAQHYEDFLRICFQRLRYFLAYGIEILLRTDVPEVKVTRKADHDGMETLICHVGGFYPKDIDIDWKRDEEVWLQDIYHGLVSPNSDGTYYTWRSVTVDPMERERYKCHVEHDGLLNPVDVAWEEPASNLGLIIGCVVGVLLLMVLVAALAGIVVYFKKRQDGYKAAAASDQGSNSSGAENRQDAYRASAGSDQESKSSEAENCQDAYRASAGSDQGSNSSEAGTAMPVVVWSDCECSEGEEGDAGVESEGPEAGTSEAKSAWTLEFQPQKPLCMA